MIKEFEVIFTLGSEGDGMGYHIAIFVLLSQD